MAKKGSMKKIVLLNPPADNYFIRDYYSGHLSKGRYYWPPQDLLSLSGILKDDYAVTVLDAIGQDYDERKVRSLVKELAPDCVLSLAAAVSWGSDMQFLSRLKELGDFLIVISGDYPRAQPEKVIREYPFIDAVLLDFTDSDIKAFIDNGPRTALKNIYTKCDSGKPALIVNEHFAYPAPAHELFPLERYHLPHILYHPYTTILTDFGCPHHCTFCFFEKISHKIRTLDNIAQELKHIASLGIQEIWLRDRSFGSVRGHALGFCDLLKKSKKRFSWSCEMRVDAADEGLLTIMKKSGCHTVMFGVESASQHVLEIHKKGISLSQVKDAFRLARKTGLRTVAHFMVGLNGETPDTQLQLIDFCLSLEPDYVSFNVASPLWNTDFRQQVIENGWLIDKGIEVDCSCSYPVWETDQLKRSQVWEIRKSALRRFYLRPSYILKRLACAQTPYQYYTFLREGLFFLRNNWRDKDKDALGKH